MMPIGKHLCVLAAAMLASCGEPSTTRTPRCTLRIVAGPGAWQD